MLFCFTSISAEIVQHILGYSICSAHHILKHLGQLLVVKSIKNCLCKSWSVLAIKMLAKLTSGVEWQPDLKPQCQDQ